MLIAFRHIQPIEPGGLGRAVVVKEKNVGGDGGIGRKDAAGIRTMVWRFELTEQLLF